MSVLSCTGYGDHISMTACGSRFRVGERVFDVDEVHANGLGEAAELAESERVALVEALMYRQEVRAGRLVYFVQGIGGGPIKIGAAKDIAKRVRQLQCAAADRLTVLSMALGGFVEEKRLHTWFRAARMSGEWFAPVDELLEHIDALPSVEGLGLP